MESRSCRHFPSCNSWVAVHSSELMFTECVQGAPQSCVDHRPTNAHAPRTRRRTKGPTGVLLTNELCKTDWLHVKLDQWHQPDSQDPEPHFRKEEGDLEHPWVKSWRQSRTMSRIILCAKLSRHWTRFDSEEERVWPTPTLHVLRDEKTHRGRCLSLYLCRCNVAWAAMCGS